MGICPFYRDLKAFLISFKVYFVAKLRSHLELAFGLKLDKLNQVEFEDKFLSSLRAWLFIRLLKFNRAEPKQLNTWFGFLQPYFLYFTFDCMQSKYVVIC